MSLRTFGRTGTGDHARPLASPRRVIAQILNGEDLPDREVEDRSSLARYAVVRHHRQESMRLIVAEDSAHRPSAFGRGIIAETTDFSLAETVAQALNRIDPLPRARVIGHRSAPE